MQGFVKYPGDASQLAYIRDRYNALLTLKTDLETALLAVKYTKENPALFMRIQDELISLDNLRTSLVNRHGVSVDVSNIPVVDIREKRVSIFTLSRPENWPQAEKSAHKKISLTEKEVSKLKKSGSAPTRVQMKIKKMLGLNTSQFNKAKKSGLLEKMATTL